MDSFSAQSRSVHDAAIFPGLLYNVRSGDFSPVHLDFVFGDAVCCLATGCCHSWKALLEVLTRRNCFFRGRKKGEELSPAGTAGTKHWWEGCVNVKVGCYRYFTALDLVKKITVKHLRHCGKNNNKKEQWARAQNCCRIWTPHEVSPVGARRAPIPGGTITINGAAPALYL